jgi:tRNA modification GTPase
MPNYLENQETIVALATGKGNSALAIFRISGRQAITYISNCILQKNTFLASQPRSIKIYKFVDFNKKMVDEITVIKYLSPESYTGENMVEIICHGGEIIVEEILEILLKNGIRLANKGEFTRRAFLNGKMDLMKAESVQQIIGSTNKKQINCAREMYEGRTQKKLLELKTKLKSVLAILDAIIEFPEEDDIKEKDLSYIQKIDEIRCIIDEEIRKREKIISDIGTIIPIVGIANAGKSSLFNLIVGFNRVIVHYEEGTTRDAVSEEIIINGEKIKLIDTAGLNETENPIEILGIRKTWEYVEKGNIVLWVTPSNKKIMENEIKITKTIKSENIIAIISKSDLNKGEEKKKYLNDKGISYIQACFVNDKESNKVIDFIGEKIKKITKESDEEPGFICNKRHEEIIITIKKKISSLMEKAKIMGEETISYEIKGILTDLNEFVGETTSEEILNMIFSDFCVGK